MAKLSPEKHKELRHRICKFVIDELTAAGQFANKDNMVNLLLNALACAAGASRMSPNELRQELERFAKHYTETYPATIAGIEVAAAMQRVMAEAARRNTERPEQ